MWELRADGDAGEGWEGGRPTISEEEEEVNLHWVLQMRKKPLVVEHTAIDLSEP